MNRRNFFRTMVGGMATAAAVRTWPFRVYSFPVETPKIYTPGVLRAFERDAFINRWDMLYGFGNLTPDNCVVRIVGDFE